MGGRGGQQQIAIGCLCLGLGLAASQARAAPVTPADLPNLTIEQLADIEVTSVSKRPQAASQAPSAVYVITRDDIARSGARTVPEILRLAPNLEVAQTSASAYVITARGFNGSPSAQNFSNKLLVLIDGRSVYSPLYSGVYWDMQDVLPEDIDRIEVVSGPGATLWGANAVNGVINIITRGADETRGGLVSVSGGDQGRDLGLRYGGSLAPDLAYRVYAHAVEAYDADLTNGRRAHDHWSRPQAGFRLDWGLSADDTLTLQGDAYSGLEGQPNALGQDIRGANLTGRWSRSRDDGSNLQLQGYFDHVERRSRTDGSGFYVDTYDLDLQHGFALSDRQQVVWGGGARLSRYHIDGTGALLFAPAGRDLSLVDIFAQDSIDLTPALNLVLGVKVEGDPYVGAELLPNLRLSWQARNGLTVWGAVSRAVRSPTPFDRDVNEKLGGRLFLIGGPNFQPEEVVAYELGLKLTGAPRTSLSVSAFYNDYDDLRSIEVAPGGFTPLRWGNLMQGRTYGLEAWGAWQATSWWRLSGGATYLREAFGFAPGSSRILGKAQAADDPKYQAFLDSAMDVGDRVRFDANLRYVGALPNPRAPAFAELDSRLAWRLDARTELSLAGRNLLHARHQEYVGGELIPRSLAVALQWRF